MVSKAPRIKRAILIKYKIDLNFFIHPLSMITSLTPSRFCISSCRDLITLLSSELSVTKKASGRGFSDMPASNEFNFNFAWSFSQALSLGSKWRFLTKLLCFNVELINSIWSSEISLLRKTLIWASYYILLESCEAFFTSKNPVAGRHKVMPITVIIIIEEIQLDLILIMALISAWKWLWK